MKISINVDSKVWEHSDYRQWQSERGQTDYATYRLLAVDNNGNICGSDSDFKEAKYPVKVYLTK